MAEPEDTEITLGTGKMLALFFGLVALCAVFFGMGYKLGRSSVPPIAVVGEASAASSVNAGTRPSATKPTADSAANPSQDAAFYKPSEQKAAASSGSSEPASAPASTPAAAGSAPAADPAAAPPSGGYYVQVAAVSKQEDGDALVDALKKKQYPAFSASGPDKLFHVEIGPYADIKNAEEMRAKLVGDGYNPILKK